MQDILTYLTVLLTIIFFVIGKFRKKENCNKCSGCTSDCPLNSANKIQNKNLFNIIR
ncbi:MAG TPA: hypothetical protein PLI27_01840 [Ignavibacteriales bacterium]|nr:hypothetical protein [Ignavibacteriales bacterium]HOL80926.1 hypothetical protein [Ignavibacteriales bacterium]HOM64661.1 hypothetical protein [Ignavibacteriales bacterium]HPD66808.1 hypothetical protein [Ignavibacteriales bacterium]HPP32706.1 hypothetical protein [Ignavibacteriales bacterium]